MDDYLRYVLFTSNETAEIIAKWEQEEYDGAFVGVCELEGLYPLSPKEIADYVEDTPDVEQCAIVEAFMPYNKLGLFKTVKRDNIISVNKCVMRGVYAPLKRNKSCCAFNRITDISKDQLGWEHPMGGISYLRNKQCMLPMAYCQMYEKMAKAKGVMYMEYFELYFKDMIFPESFIEMYNL